jgi:hypothetical protein
VEHSDLARVHEQPADFLWFQPRRRYKLIRLEAIMATLGNMHPLLPMLPSTLLSPTATLVIVLCYMTNALVNRPQSSSDFPVLADTCSVHAMIRGVLTAVVPLNAFQLHSLVIGACPRISSHRTLSIEVIAGLCGVKGGASHAEVLALIRRTDQARPRGQQTLPVWGQADDADGAGPSDDGAGSRKRASGVGPVSRAKKLKLIVGDGAERAITQEEQHLIPEPAAVSGFASEEEDPERPGRSVTNVEIVNNIFTKMTGEILLKVPSIPKQGRSWRLASDNQCHQLRYSTLRNASELPGLLVGWRQVSDPNRWSKTVNKLFPTAEECIEAITYRNGEPLRTFPQGLKQCSWFREWTALMVNEHTPVTRKQVRALWKFAHDKINREAQWLPLGKSDRLWSEAGGGGAVVHGENVNGTGGMTVIFNPAFNLELDVPGGR